MEKEKEQKPSESGTSEEGGQRAIRVFAPALTRAARNAGRRTARGLDPGREGRGAEANPQTMLGARVLRAIRENPETVWCLRTHTLTFHLAAPAAAARAAVAALPKATGVAPLREGPGRGGHFLVASDRDSICSDCSLTSWRHKAKIPQVGAGVCPPRWDDSLPVVLGTAVGGSRGL